ncbi:MAG TPA: glutathione S-transferase family protein, partial [Micavibrio sp.]
MYKLYYSPGACSMAVHVVLNELAAKFDLEKVTAEQRKDAAFLTVNPRGQVPVLLIDGEPMKEGAAILLYLLDTHGSPLMPKSGMARAKALEWLMWCNASLHPACGKMFWLNKVTMEEKAKEELKKSVSAQVQSLWDEAETRLAKSKYLAGDQATAADILMTVIANWGIGSLGPNVKRVIGEV